MKKKGEYWLIAVPNTLPPSDSSANAYTWKILTSKLHGVAEVHPFNLPELRTGTLNKLMKAADVLSKLDVFSEGLVRKVERQFNDLITPDSPQLGLEVEELPVLQYIEHWQWKMSSFPIHRSIQDLVSTIQTYAKRIDEDLKESISYLQDKRTVLSQLLRKTQGGLAVADLRSFLTSEIIVDHHLGETEYTIDVAVLVPKNAKKIFLAEYESLVAEAVSYEGEKGSPVIPRSSIQITEDKEYILFTIKVLKKFLRDIKVGALEKRYVVKDIDFSVVQTQVEVDSSDDEDAESPDLLRRVEVAKQDLRYAVVQTTTWCQAHYGEAVTAWLHVKALRVYIEAALRYGLPINFAAALIEVDRSSNKQRVRKILFDKYKSLDEEGMMVTEKEEGIAEELFPYISFDLNIFGTK